MFNPFGPVVMRQVIQRIGQSVHERPRRVWAITLGLKEGCPSILAEACYKETARVTYGRAKVSIFINDARETESY